MRDEAGTALAQAIVRIECTTWGQPPLLRDAVLARAPLPRTRSTRDGSFVLALTPEHDLLGDFHGALILVVELEGRQRWRERLPSPLACWQGSEVVLPAVQAADMANVRVEAPPPSARLRFARVHDAHWMFVGPVAPGEVDEVVVPASGEVRLPLPLVPNPCVVDPGDGFAPLGWTVQLFAPDRTSEPRAIAGGDSLTFVAPAKSEPEPGTTSFVRVLCRMPDDTLRVFARPAGLETSYPPLPILAVQRADDRWHLGWKGREVAAQPTPRELVLRTPDGRLVRDALVSLLAPEELRYFAPTQSFVPDQVASVVLGADNGRVALPRELAGRCAAWITAPGHEPECVLDVRTLNEAGSVTLRPFVRTATFRVHDDRGNAVVGALVCATVQRGSGTSLPAFAITLAGGSLPRTDTEGLCVLHLPDDSTVVRFVHCDYQVVDLVDASDPATDVVARLRHRFDVRTLDADGRPVPFAPFGYTRVTHRDGSGTSEAIYGFVSDSTGRASIAVLDEDVSVAAAEMSEFVGKKQRLVAGQSNDLAVARDPFVVVRIPTAMRLLYYVPEPGGRRRKLGGTHFVPAHTQALLLRWPASLPKWTHAVPDAPPVVVSIAEIDRTGSPSVLDRRGILRRVPLQLEGAVPDNLGFLQVSPRPTRGPWLWLPGNHVERVEGKLMLAVRDTHAHDVFIMHPDTVPCPAILPAATSATPVVIGNLRRGTPCTIRVTLRRALMPDDRLLLLAHTMGFLSQCVGVAEIDGPSVAAARIGEVLSVRAPFALPKGTIRLTLWGAQRSSDQVINVGDVPVEVDFGAWGN